MSKRNLSIPIDAEDKYCGECDHKIWEVDYYGLEYLECDIFEEKLKGYYTKLKRCQACLDAEQKPSNIFDRLWKWAEKFCEHVEDEPLIIELNEILKDLHAEVKKC